MSVVKLRVNISQHYYLKQIRSYNILLFQALVQTSSDSETGMVAVEDDDDGSDDEGEGNKDADNDDNMSADGSSSSDDDDESEDSGIEEEKDVVVEDKLKEKVRLALGDAAGNPDEEVYNSRFYIVIEQYVIFINFYTFE